MRKYLFSLVVLALSTVIPLFAMAGNLVTDGLDDPYVVPAPTATDDGLSLIHI